MVTSPRRLRSTARLVDAAVTLLCTEGVGGVSVQRVADTAGVSKGLVHYHFRDKDALLAACASALVADLVARDELARQGADATGILDGLWRALESSLQDGRRRAWLALCAESPPAIRDTLAALAADRHAAALALLGTLADLLSWTPRVPRPTLAAAYVALGDGLALDAAIRLSAEHRRAFDAFWFSVLADGG